MRLILTLICLSVLAGSEYLRTGRTAGASAPESKQSANPSPDEIWRTIQDGSAGKGRDGSANPGIRVQLDRDALAALLRQAPLEFTRAATSNPVVIPLPMPDGTFAKFRIVESSIMEPELAAKFRDIKTYSGQGIDDRTATTRFDLTPTGFHAVVLSLQGVISISPISNGDQTAYTSYNAKDLPRTAGDFRCQVDESNEKLVGQTPEMNPNFVIGTTLRTYRLAMGVTAEWTAAYGGGTIPGGLAAVTTAVNNVNAVLEKETAIRLILVANENLLISTNTATDGYTHCADPNFCDVSTTLDVENETKLDSVIGSANYDIGHVMDGEPVMFGSSAFGAAFFGVCVDGTKGKGGGIYRSSPPDSPTCIRSLTHEMGHQFFARHTFNGTTSGCGFFNRDPLSAYEPGSGSTIMSYTGNCDTENLPATSLYHTATLEQITAYSTTGGGNTCAQQISTGNNPPVLAPGGAFTIPKGTPFTLTAIASDIDGDMLTYSWEEFDNAAATAPPNTDADGQQRPIFRVFDPVISPSRTFPRLSDILNNTSTFGEALPAITRTMTFKVTVRDNHAGGGGVVNGATTLSIAGGAGPFAVTAPNTAVTWTGGATQAVTWSVNSTNLAPVSCANVKISLSTDGGSTFPLILAASTPNDGTENVTIPNGVSSTQARVKVEAVGNIFFDISNANFTVTPGGTCPAIESISQSIGSVGTSIVITGANFTGVTAVTFFNNVIAGFTINSATQITTTVPAGAVTGPITISKPSCSDVQTGSITVSGSPSSDLKVDNGLSGCLGAGGPGTSVLYVNRLTPSSYPATLTSVLIDFPDIGCGLALGTNIAIVVGNNASGGSSISGTTLQETATTVQPPQNGFKAYPVPNVTITTGDFVVGFRITAASNLFPVLFDQVSANQNRSYLSFDGSNFDLVGNVFSGFGVNFLIRARVFSGAANCPTITSINPTSGPAGTTVTITGTNLSGVTKARFSNNITVSFNLNSDTQITTTVPDGAVTGPLTVSKTGCTDVQTATFTISPTAVRLIDFTATEYDDGVFLQWQTGFEVDNLGFNIYREEGLERTLITPQPVAGSALKANAMLGAGASYGYWDGNGTRNATYALEDIDLKGFSTWHTPVYTNQVGSQPPTRLQPAPLSKLGSDQASDKCHSVEATASYSPVSFDQTQVQASLASQFAMKIAVEHEGWYRVTQPELVAAGFDTSVNPRSLQLFVDGRDLPIIVQGENDGSLDPSDAIEFYGIGLDSPFTSSRVYWLAAGDQPGRRMKRSTTDGVAAGLSSFSYAVERRDRTIYFSALRNGERENFFGAVIAGNPVDQSITISHPTTSGSHSAVLEVTLQGVTFTRHRVNIELNGSSVGVLDFDDQSRDVGRFDLPQSLVLEGENNVRLTPLGGSSDVTLVDSIRVSYHHSLTADNNALRLTLPGYQLVTIDGFTSDSIRAIDVTDPQDPREIVGTIGKTKDGYSIRLASPAGGERALLVTADLRRASLSLNLPSNLRTRNADFVIITRRKLAASVGPLVALRQSQGFSVAVVDLEDIYDEFSFGQKTPLAIRDFLTYGKSHWKKKPRFVLFAGDASFDPRNYLGFGDTDLVPTKLIDTDFLETASDDWFSDFDNDGIADIATGRLPARTSEELSAMVSKIVRYEQSGPADEALLVADANDGFDFEQSSAQLRSLIPPSLKITQLNRGGLDPAMARRSLFEALNGNQSIVNYVGHASVGQWRGNLLTDADALSLSNENLPMFVMMTCLNGYFHDPAQDSLGEGLIKARRGGAVAVWASSGMTLPTDQALLNQELYRVLFSPDRAPTIGEAVMRAKSGSSSADIRRTWILLGDPAMKLRR